LDSVILAEGIENQLAVSPFKTFNTRLDVGAFIVGENDGRDFRFHSSFSKGVLMRRGAPAWKEMTIFAESSRF
jgi:hypothetical protein